MASTILVLMNQTIGLACLIFFLLLLYLTLTSVIDSSGHSPELESLALKMKRPFSPIAPIACDRSHKDYDLCSINGPTLLDPITATFFLVSSTDMNPPSFLMKTKPYPRKSDKEAMSRVKELTLTLNSPPPNVSCGVTHTSSAIVFSTGGYIENPYHQFMDGFLPLYITINFLIQGDHQDDVILVITDYKDWWNRKYTELLAHFSRHPIINMDNETVTHCFPSVNVGLITHGYSKVNPKLLPQPKTLIDFKFFLDDVYSQGDSDVTMYQIQQKSTRPRLLLMNRNAKVGRLILNLAEIVKTAEVIGFDVIIMEPTVDTSLLELFRLIQASHAMLGVHGAALTHFLFLRPGAVLMQVVPIGTQENADMCFGDPATVLGLQYLDYKVHYEESSLAERYAPDDLVMTNPEAFVEGKWKNMLVYMNQNLKVDIVKFRMFLKDAYKKAKMFMEEEIG